MSAAPGRPKQARTAAREGEGTPVSKVHQPAEAGACPWTPAELLPHAGDAVLLDHVRSWSEQHLEATAVPGASPLYQQEDGSLPNWLGLEIMAQAVAAWAGCQARQAGRPVELGFLLGTRRYDCRVDRYPAGQPLAVRVQPSLHDATGMGVFETWLRDAATGELLAEARLNVYRPGDVLSYLQEAPPNPSSKP